MSLFGVSSSKVATPAQRLLAGNLRAFQTLSSSSVTIATKSKHSEDERRNNDTTIKNNILANNNIGYPIQTTNTRFSSTISKQLSSLANNNDMALMKTTLATRFMSGLPENNFRNGKPTLEYAKEMPKTFASMTNDQILHFAELGIPEACRECIIRDVMTVDQIEYDEAMEVFKEIAKSNREGMSVASLPFKFGLGASVIGGYASIPLVFHLNTVQWFNERFVTSELPPLEDLETWLEVGSASWGWMEPVLGHISFFLLSMQFARSQLQNLGIRPYFNWQRERRAARLVEKYPRYDREFLINYSKIDELLSAHHMSP